MNAAHAVETKGANDRSTASRNQKNAQAVPEIIPGAQTGFTADQLLVQRKENSCACGGGCPKCLSSLGIQAKLKIGAPNDVYEQEADRVADQVMRMTEPKVQETSQANTNPVGIKSGMLTSKADTAVQRKADEEELIQAKPLVQTISSIVQRQTEEESNDDLIQAKATAGVTSAVTPAIGASIQSLRGGGQPLSKSERSFFEPRFGADFSGVRVHNDARAAGLAQSVNARAFAHGRDVVFGNGEYSPNTISGKRLLAHELAHVVQANSSSGVRADTVRRQEEAPMSPRECLRRGLRLQNSREPTEEELDRQMESNRQIQETHGVTIDPCEGLESMNAEPSVGANEVFPYPGGANLRFNELVTQSIPQDLVEGLINMMEVLDEDNPSLPTARSIRDILYGDIPRSVNVTVEESTARVFRVSGTSPLIPASGDSAEIPPFGFSFTFEWEPESDTFEAIFEPEGGEEKRLDGIAVSLAEDGRISLQIERLPGVDIPARIEIAEDDSGSREISVPVSPQAMLEQIFDFPLRLVGIEQVSAAEAAEPVEARPPPSSPIPFGAGLSVGLGLSPDPVAVLGASWIYTFQPIGPFIRFPILLNLSYVPTTGVIAGISGGVEGWIPTDVPMSIRLLGGLSGGSVEQNVAGVDTRASILGPSIGVGFGLGFGDVDVRVDYSTLFNVLDEGPDKVHTFTLGSVINFR